MQFSKISIAAVSMAILSLSSAAPTSDNAAHIEARANCFGEAVAKGAQCVAGCVGKSGASDCITGCNVTTLGELAGCVAGR